MMIRLTINPDPIETMQYDAWSLLSDLHWLNPPPKYTKVSFATMKGESDAVECETHDNEDGVEVEGEPYSSYIDDGKEEDGYDYLDSVSDALEDAIESDIHEEPYQFEIEYLEVELT